MITWMSKICTIVARRCYDGLIVIINGEMWGSVLNPPGQCVRLALTLAHCLAADLSMAHHVLFRSQRIKFLWDHGNLHRVSGESRTWFCLCKLNWVCIVMDMGDVRNRLPCLKPTVSTGLLWNVCANVFCCPYDDFFLWPKITRFAQSSQLNHTVHLTPEDIWQPCLISFCSLF